MKASLKKHKKIVVIVGTVLILLASLAAFSYREFRNELEVLNSAMTSSIATFEGKITRAENISKINKVLNNQLTNGSEYVAQRMFRKSGSIPETLDAMQSDAWDYYLIDASGKVYAAREADPLNLSGQQLEQLFEEKKLQTLSGDNILNYHCTEVNPGTLISVSKEPVMAGINSLLTGLSGRFDYYIANASDGIIIAAGDSALEGSSVPDQLEKPFIETEKTYLSNGQRYPYGFAAMKTGQAYCLTSESAGYKYGMYYHTTDIILDVLTGILSPAAVLMGSLIVIVAFFFILWKNGDNREKKWIRIGKTKAFFEKNQVKHLAGFILFSLLVTILFNAHYMGFAAYSLQNTLSTQNLDVLAENMEACETDKEQIIGLVKDYLQGIANQFANAMTVEEKLCSHDSLKEIAENCYINTIDIYDVDGILEASSDDYYGYELTTDETNPMYAARRVLTEDAEYVFKDYADTEGYYYLAQKRKDAPGIICLKFNNPELAEMLHYYSKEEAIRGTDFGNATTFFVKMNGTETYVIEPHSTTVHVTNNKLPEKLEQDRYSGSAEINGFLFYVNTRNSSDILVVSAIRSEKLVNMVWIVAAAILISYLLLALLLFYGCICYPVADENAETDNAETEPPAMLSRKADNLFEDTCFREMIKYELSVVLAAYCIMMFRTMKNGQTVLEFILNGKWDKGLNLFSINASIIMAAIVCILVFLIRKILMFIGKSIGNKGITVCSITCSLLSFLSLFGVVLYTLYQFGVNTTALIASAGITGLVVGVATKDIIGDLIAGLFLIFEGNIRVGDFVKVKDFRGEVYEISARVTTIKRYSTKYIINNSDLKQFYRLSDEPSGAWVEIDVAPDSDIDKIRELIDSSAEWYMSRIPALLEGPKFSNISELDSLHITICLFGRCLEERSGSTRRKILINTMELFRENNIKLGPKYVSAITVLPEDRNDS